MDRGGGVLGGFGACDKEIGVDEVGHEVEEEEKKVWEKEPIHLKTEIRA